MCICVNPDIGLKQRPAASFYWLSLGSRNPLPLFFCSRISGIKMFIDTDPRGDEVLKWDHYCTIDRRNHRYFFSLSQSHREMLHRDSALRTRGFTNKGWLIPRDGRMRVFHDVVPRVSLLHSRSRYLSITYLSRVLRKINFFISFFHLCFFFILMRRRCCILFSVPIT